MNRFGFLFVGAGLAALLVLAGGLVGGFLNLPAFLITVGGTAIAGCLAFPPAKIADLLRRIGEILAPTSEASLSAAIARLSAIYRVGGVRRLEEAEGSVSSPFLRFGISLVVDGYDRGVIEEWMAGEIAKTRTRFETHQRILRTLVKLAPAFGLVGTIIGLILMFRSLNDMSQMGPALSVALLTTLYGVLLANLFLLPLSAHLRERSDEEIGEMETTLDGVLMIRDAVNPKLIARRLASAEMPAPRTAERVEQSPAASNPKPLRRPPSVGGAVARA